MTPPSMEQNGLPAKPGEIDRIFQALGDPTRRAILQQLGSGPLSASRLSEPLDISLAAVIQHLRVLEDSGLVRTEKTGRVRTCSVRAEGLCAAERWIRDRRRTGEKALDEPLNDPDT